MRQLKVPAFFILMALVLVACGGEETPTPMPTLAQTAAPVEAPTEPVAEVAPATTVAAATTVAPATVVAAATTVATVTATPEPTKTPEPTPQMPDPELIGGVWHWQEFQDTAGLNDITVPDPENYTLTLQADGTAAIQADCNQLSWTYELEGSSLTFNTLGPSTLAYCGEDSLDQQYLALLGDTATYVEEESKLFLNLKLDAGNMVFGRADVPSAAEESSAGDEEDESFFPDTIQLDMQGLAQSYDWQVVGASPIPPGPGGKGFPRHIIVGFDGENPLELPFTERRVMHLFPVDSYEKLYEASGNSTVTGQVERLEELIAGAGDRQGMPDGWMPLLPPPGSLMDRWVQFADLNFEEGQGVRYVSDSPFRQSIGVWANDTMGYYYQGLTDDGRFYISLIWPVSTSLLPETAADAPAETVEQATASRESYDQYQEELKTSLNALGPADWSPDLSTLDAMIASLRFQYR